MKSAIFAITALAVAVAAQDQNNLPECAQTCVNNMRSQMKAEELGCREGDIRCLCTNPNFSYGLRDCTSEVCGNREQDVNTVFDYARNICQQAGVAIATTGGASGSGGASETVATVLSTFSSGGSAMTTAVATTTISGGAASSQSSNSDSNNASQTPSASHSGSGNNGGGGAGNTGTGGASSTSSGFAPQMTAAPVGMLAVAGIAAFMM
ncbi:hypothetical protein CDD83_9722 [Cordyceps sp. RAO-2017]|nr:hypothetical protein CDD83_9722 [Cordyceps sp. RAO-2017]